MASHTFSQKKFVPTPPEKGSFPLDHESLCKKYYILYMTCLSRNDDDNSKCRQEAKEYLGCRMDNQLMERVAWSKLGFEDETMKIQKNLLIACTGSVATIKLPLLIEKFEAPEAPFQYNIKVVTTKYAKHFINEGDVPKHIPLLEDPDEWNAWSGRGDPVLHIDLGKWADMLLIAPLSANSLAKIVGGICDNLLLCIVRAWDRSKPLLFCPAMNTRMYEHPVTNEHIEKLKSWTYQEIPCVSKMLMCGDSGLGAMAEVPEIVKAVNDCFQTLSN